MRAVFALFQVCCILLLLACIDKKGSNSDSLKKNIEGNQLIVKKNITTKQRIDSLITVYHCYKNDTTLSRKSQMLNSFFLLFPEKFSSFIDIYGYKEITPDSATYSPLYETSYDHIELFFATKKVIDEKLFIRKVISISIDGYWASDAVSVFKHHLTELVNSNKMLFYEVLKTFNNQQMKSFWMFYFDQIHQDGNGLKKLKEFESFDLKMYAIMKTCYEQSLESGCKGN